MPEQARPLVDPNALDPAGGTAIDWFVPSHEGALVAVSLSRGGSERGDVHIVRTATGQEVGDVVTRVNYGTAGGGLAWDGKGEGFFYTRYPRPGERPDADLDFYVQVYYHRIGTPESTDRYEIGRDFARIAEPKLRSTRDGRFVVANVQFGDSGQFEQHLRKPDGTWVRLTRFEDRVVDAVFGPGDTLYLLSRAGAPRGKLLRLSLTGPLTLADAKPLVSEGEAVISFDFWGASTIEVTPDRLFVIAELGGPQRVDVYAHDGRRLGQIPIPPISSVYEVSALADNSALLVCTASYVQPATWFRVDLRPAKDAALVPTKLTVPLGLDLGPVEVVTEQATSKDGTRVPMVLIRPKGVPLDGRNPTLLTGYGGLGISQSPSFDLGRRLWLEQGGVVAVAVLRGGGEFGDEWHEAGRLLKKQNVFDDFIAVAEHLVRTGVTSRERLVIEGGSNGGLLMGALLTQRPDLVRAVVSHVGIYDMLRVELSPNGAFNVPEFGSVKDEAQFRALFAYSPYHHVRDGAPYPPVLFLTGANDPRVDPMQSRKMTARLQTATAAAGRVLLRTSAASGHGIGTSLDEQIEQEVDVWAFVFHQLGLTYRPVAMK